MRLGIGFIFAAVLVTTPAAAQSTADELLRDCETFLSRYGCMLLKATCTGLIKIIVQISCNSVRKRAVSGMHLRRA